MYFGGSAAASTADDEDSTWLRSLEEFKRQTELLKKQIAEISP
jgi:hypothetical protein